MNQNETLSPIQIRAIKALLECRNLKTVAKTIGVGRSTLQRWMREQDFRDELAHAETDLIDGITRSLLAGVNTALEVLYGIMVNGDETNIRRNACNDWLTHSANFRELVDLTHRVEVLEGLQNEKACK